MHPLKTPENDNKVYYYKLKSFPKFIDCSAKSIPSVFYSKDIFGIIRIISYINTFFLFMNISVKNKSEGYRLFTLL